MRLLIVGTLKGQLTTATKIAMDNGASVTHAENNEQAMAVLRGGKGADLLMVDVALDIRDLVIRLEAEHIHVPIVACGITSDARAAVAASHANRLVQGPSALPAARQPPAGVAGRPGDIRLAGPAGLAVDVVKQRGTERVGPGSRGDRQLPWLGVAP